MLSRRATANSHTETRCLFIPSLHKKRCAMWYPTKLAHHLMQNSHLCTVQFRLVTPRNPSTVNDWSAHRISLHHGLLAMHAQGRVFSLRQESFDL